MNYLDSWNSWLEENLPDAVPKGMGMRSVKIDRTELLEILKKNREQHIKDFEEAKVGYREDAVKELSEMLEGAKSGGDIKRHINAIQPMSYEDSYNTVIRMLELSIDSSVELTMQEFQQ